MILDSLKNSASYSALHPRMKRAFELVASRDWTRFEPGIHELDGRDIYASLSVINLKQREDAKLEVHNEYIDIHILVEGREETFGWSERDDMRMPRGEFDAEKDILFFDDEPQTYYTMRQGQFSIFLPEDAHAPMVGEGPVRKIIVKVRK